MKFRAIALYRPHRVTVAEPHARYFLLRGSWSETYQPARQSSKNRERLLHARWFAKRHSPATLLVPKLPKAMSVKGSTTVGGATSPTDASWDVARLPRRPEMNTIYVGGKAYSVGDAVELRNPNSAEHPFVARARSFYKTGPRDKDIAVLLQWFYRPADLPAGVVEQIPVETEENELFETKHMDENHADALCGKCVVHRVKTATRWKVMCALVNTSKNPIAARDNLQYICCNAHAYGAGCRQAIHLQVLRRHGYRDSGQAQREGHQGCSA